MGTKERRAQEKEQRLNQILDAARVLLFSHGVSNISISKIAKKAELGVGTIYFYFKNKEEIFVALQEEGLSLFYDIINDIRTSDKPEDEKLLAVARSFYRFTSDHKDYYDIINTFLSASKEFFEPDLKARVDMAGAGILNLIRKIIEQGVENHTLNCRDAAKHAVFFFSSLHGLMQLKKLEHTALAGENHKQIYDFAVEQLMSGFKPS